MWYNPLVSWLLRSPLHALIDKNFTLISYTGRKSGRQYTLPVNYWREANALWIISKRERTWWRSLRGGAPLSLLLDGAEVSAVGEVLEAEESLLPALGAFLARVPQLARYYKVGMDENGAFRPADLVQLGKTLVLVRAELQA